MLRFNICRRRVASRTGSSGVWSCLRGRSCPLAGGGAAAAISSSSGGPPLSAESEEAAPPDRQCRTGRSIPPLLLPPAGRLSNYCHSAAAPPPRPDTALAAVHVPHCNRGDWSVNLGAIGESRFDIGMRCTHPSSLFSRIKWQSKRQPFPLCYYHVNKGKGCYVC